MERSVASVAITVNAFSVPESLAAAFHRRDSPEDSKVLPAETAFHVEPLHFSRVVEAVTPSILKLGSGVSTSAIFEAAARVAYGITRKLSSVAPVSVLTVVSVGTSLTGLTLTLT